MTDARMPERYLNDRNLLRLSDGAFRAFVTAMIWSVSNRTDGVLEQDDIGLIHSMSTDRLQELIAADKIAIHDRGYYLVDFANTQTSRSELEVLENMRRREREKKKRQRTVPGDVPGDVSPGTAQERKGEDRTGKDRPGQVTERKNLRSVEVAESLPSDAQRSAMKSWGLDHSA